MHLLWHTKHWFCSNWWVIIVFQCQISTYGQFVLRVQWVRIFDRLFIPLLIANFVTGAHQTFYYIQGDQIILNCSPYMENNFHNLIHHFSFLKVPKQDFYDCDYFLKVHLDLSKIFLSPVCPFEHPLNIRPSLIFHNLRLFCM